jgi:hypothetical protein
MDGISLYNIDTIDRYCIVALVVTCPSLFISLLDTKVCYSLSCRFYENAGIPVIALPKMSARMTSNPDQQRNLRLGAMPTYREYPKERIEAAQIVSTKDSCQTIHRVTYVCT